MPEQVLLIQANEACSEGAIAAGCRFFAGYPITPSTEIAESMSEKLPRIGGKFIEMEDEIASIGAITGASVAGLEAMTATSGPGFSLMQEGIGYDCMAEIPLVIVNVMRGGPSTGLPTKTSQADVLAAQHPPTSSCEPSPRTAGDTASRPNSAARPYRAVGDAVFTQR